MEHLKEILGIASTISGLIGLGTYIFAIRLGKIKPHCFTWMVWAVVMLIAFFAQVSDSAGAGAWVTGMSGVICGFISVYAYFRGETNITRSDWIAFIGALSAIPIWYITNDPLYAVLIVSLIDAVGFFPTFRKSWHRPYEESVATFSIAICTFTLSIAALSNYSPTTVIYPLSLMLSNVLFVAMVVWRRNSLGPQVA